MRYLRQILTGIFLLLALLLLAFWLTQLDQSPATGNSNPDIGTPADDASEILATSPRSEAIIGVTPTRSETSEIRATNTANPGTTLELESTHGPTASTTSSSQSLTPSALPSPIDVKESPSTRPTATKPNQLDSVDRACPEPSPAKPDYYHYYLSGNPWPEPRPDP